MGIGNSKKTENENIKQSNKNNITNKSNSVSQDSKRK